MKHWLFDPNILASMPHSTLYSMRDHNAADRSLQELLAPYEHRAFAREWAREDPLLAALSIPFAAPAYYAGKAIGQPLGLFSDATPPSLEQLKQAYIGLFEGLLKGR